MATPALAVPPGAPVEVEYPESDGRPMAESDVHYRRIVDVRHMLERYFADEPAVYVSGNLLLYYEEGEPRLCVAPDILVVQGVPKGLRRVYKRWEEGRVPQFVLEVTSRSTRGEDLGAKRGLYEWLGVQEYFLYDPLAEYLSPPLRGYRLVEGRFEPITPASNGALVSQVLGLELHLRDGELRLFDPRAGRWLPTPAEEGAARQEAERQAAAEAAARQQAEARAAELAAEVERLRAALAERQRKAE